CRRCGSSSIHPTAGCVGHHFVAHCCLPRQHSHRVAQCAARRRQGGSRYLELGAPPGAGSADYLGVVVHAAAGGARLTTPRRDLASVEVGLTGWLRSKLPDRQGLTISPLKKPSAGVSNETLLFDVSWRDTAHSPPHSRSEALVARLMPAGAPVFPEYDLARQFRILHCLPNTNVPVARPPWYEADEHILGCPFYVMRRINGQIPSEIPPYHAFGFTLEMTHERRARVWWSGIEMLARIHGIDWQRHGLSFLEVDN